MPHLFKTQEYVKKYFIQIYIFLVSLIIIFLHLECDCDLLGSIDDFCENNGQCKCKEGFGGKKCNLCAADLVLPYPLCNQG